MDSAGTKLAVDELNEHQARSELRRLAEEITHHDRRYYRDDAPEISDGEYDGLRARLEAIEARFPALIKPDSPSLRVGAPPGEKFEKIRHSVPMLSLGNAFSQSDIRDFDERIRRFLGLEGEDELAFTAEPKIDGLSISLRYPPISLP